MKTFTKITLLFTLVFCFTLQLSAQHVLIGMTSNGGDADAGVIFKTDLDGTNLQPIYSFQAYFGYRPSAQIMQASNGKLYGTTKLGSGILFEYDPVTGSYKILKLFSSSGEDGNYPEGGVTQASNGKLYGLTRSGGEHSDGVLYEYDLENKTYTLKVSFDRSVTGETPVNRLLEAANGLLYGITYEGGLSNEGVLFEYDPGANTIVKKVDFSSINGVHPYCTLIQAPNGLVYGTTSEGGTTDNGVLFVFNTSFGTYTKIVDFSASTGVNPDGILAVAPNGKLYGTCMSGGNHDKGTIFEYDFSSSTFRKVVDFNDQLGNKPKGGLVLHEDGYLYGVCLEGGINDEGTLFRFDPENETIVKLLDFYGEDYGEEPLKTLYAANDGTLYGTTSYGGLTNGGVLFQYNPQTNVFVKKFDFGTSDTGAVPKGGLLKANDGKLYGLTTEGGLYGCGVLFDYDFQTNTYTMNYSLDDNVGCVPECTLTQASNGLLYGVTNYNGGYLFQYDIATQTASSLWEFYFEFGRFPVSGPIQASNGKLYGLTFNGGDNNSGTLYQYDIPSGSCLKMIDFNQTTTGSDLFAGLAEAGNGLLYGVAAQGGDYNKGTLYSYDPVTYDFQVMVSFDGLNKGSIPVAGLTVVDGHLLYGVTSSGGINDDGSLFVFDTDDNSFTKLADFDNTNTGKAPLAKLLLASNGNLYGTTFLGGAANKGVLYEFSLSTHTLSKKADFNGSNGRNPYFGQLVEVDLANSINETNAANNLITIYPNPVHNYLTFTAKGFDGDVSIRILNSEGKIVLSDQLGQNHGKLFEKSYRLPDLGNGVYYLNLYDGKIKATKKFVVLSE